MLVWSRPRLEQAQARRHPQKPRRERNPVGAEFLLIPACRACNQEYLPGYCTVLQPDPDPQLWHNL